MGESKTDEELPAIGQSEDIEGDEAPSPGGWKDYPLDELAIRDERRTAQDVVRRIEKGRFILDPDFQRDFVWNIRKQSRLVESILMRIPLPVFYVAEDLQGRLIVVDGLQRLTTLKMFFSGKLRLDLEDRPELHRQTFDSLHPRLQNRLEDCQLHFYIIDHAVPERARLDIFERVNGGEVLTRQQMRNAIYNGPATIFLRDEAANDLFKRATGGSLDSKKMKDREFVNRFCSFSLLDLDDYKGDMDEWLAQGLVKVAEMGDSAREELRFKFRRGLQNNLNIFGKHSFRKHQSQDQSRNIINASLFDVMSTGLSHFEEPEVLNRSVRLCQAFYELMKDQRFVSAITYSPNTPKEVRTRFTIANDMFREVFDAS
jgi:hypothetical protein